MAANNRGPLYDLVRKTNREVTEAEYKQISFRNETRAGLLNAARETADVKDEVSGLRSQVNGLQCQMIRLMIHLGID